MGMFFPLHPGWLQDCSDALAALTDLIPRLSSASEGSRESLLCHARVCILKDEAELIQAPKKPVGRRYSNHLRETGSHRKDLHQELYFGVARGEEHPLATPTGFSCESQEWTCPCIRNAATCLLQVLTPIGEHRSTSIPKPSAQTAGHRVVVDLWHGSSRSSRCWRACTSVSLQQGSWMPIRVNSG